MTPTLALWASLALAQTADEAPADPTEASVESEATEASEADVESEAADEAVTEAPEPAPAPAPRLPGEPAPGTKHYDLELMYAEEKYTAGLEEARKRLAANPTDVDLHWHVARFMFEYAEAFEKDKAAFDKLAWYEEMLAVSEKGLALDPDNTHLMFARGIANGRLGTTRGVLASLWGAKDLERDWLHVANSGFVYSSIGGNEMLPCDAYLTLGIFYRLVPEWWIVQVLAGTRGDLDKSLEMTTKAVQCSPDRIGVAKEQAVTQLCIGTKRKDEAMLAKGKQSVERYMRMTPTSQNDYIDIEHGNKLLADPSIACEYSRDGQQELDQSKLER